MGIPSQPCPSPGSSLTATCEEATAMTSITPSRDVFVVGVDTHKDTHTACVINGLGQRGSAVTVSADSAGYERLYGWAKDQGCVAAFGIEGTGSYGAGLSRFLRRYGERVTEVDRPRRANRRRCGKTDLLDAEHAARQVLAGEATAIPKAGDGAVEMIRVVKIARDTAVKAQSQAMVVLRSTLVTAPNQVREELEDLTACRLVARCASFQVRDLTSPEAAVRYSLASLAQRWLQLEKEISEHDRQLTRLTRAAAPRLVEACGIGAVTAAELLITFGDNFNRIHSEAAFAKMCGVCPIPASSGRTDQHRLNRGGNRQANAALYRVVINRMRWHEATKAYVARRRSDGLSKRDIIRCLKRFVAREAYGLVMAGVGRLPEGELGQAIGQSA
jgi:transposase